MEQNRKSDLTMKRRRIVVALLSPTTDDLAELTDEGIDVAVCDRRSRVLSTIETAPTDALILPPTDDEGLSSVPLIRSVRRQVPRIALFIRESKIHIPLRLPLFASAGATLFLFEGKAAFAAQVRELVAPSPSPVDPVALIKRLGIDFSSETESLVTAIAGAGDRLRPARLASMVGCSRRTLNRRLRTAGLPNAMDTCALAAVMSWAASLEDEKTQDSVPQPPWIPTALRRLVRISPAEFSALQPDDRWRILRRAVDRRRHPMGKRAL